MALKAEKRVFERPVFDPDDGTEYTFRIRKLSHGDLRDRMNEAVKVRRGSRKGGKGKSKEEYQYDAKAIEFFTWNRAIVKPWPFPFPFNREEIGLLDADVADQIDAIIKEINPAIERQDRGETYEFDDEDEEEGYEENGHEDSPVEVHYAEGDAPEGAEVQADADVQAGVEEDPEAEAETNIDVETDEEVEDPASHPGEMRAVEEQVFAEEEGPTERAVSS